MLYTDHRFTRLLYACLIFMCGQSIARDADFHFWPTQIKVADPMESGALFSWPDFKVLLQIKHGATYAPAVVSDALAQELTQIFAPNNGSPITTYRDKQASSWGLTIPGGSELRAENHLLLQPMTEKMVACLSTLTTAELDRMKEIIYSPLSMLNPDGGVTISDGHKQIVASMFANFQTNRCENGTTPIPDLLTDKMRHYVSLFLSGRGTGGDVSAGAQLVISTLFRDLLFSPKGIWVRATLAMIQDFVTERLAKSPVVEELSCLEQDYQSFIDFVLISKGLCDFTKEHYLRIAQIADLDGITDLFRPFPLKQYSNEQRLMAMTLQLGTQQATYFVGGSQE